MNQEWLKAYKKYRQRKYERDLDRLQNDFASHGMVSSGQRNKEERWLKEDFEDDIAMKQEDVKISGEITKERMTSIWTNRILATIAIASLVLTTILSFMTINTAHESNDISRQIAGIEYIGLQPVLAFLTEYNDPFKFINVGKGPAFNVYLLQGNSSGFVLMNKEENTLTAQAVGYVGNIRKDQLSPVSIEEISKKLPFVYSEIKKNIDKKINWIALVYQDINNQNFISTVFGNSNFQTSAMDYKKLPTSR